MLSKEQQLEKEIKIITVATEILKSKGRIEEVYKTTGIPKSSIQRYLTSKELMNLLGVEQFDQIQSILRENKMIGLSKGGRNSVLCNEIVRDDYGRFEGVRKK